MERREFLTTLAALQVAAKLDAQTSNGMIYRNLGTTGQRVSALGLGGYHMGVPKEESESIRIVRSAIDRGITFLDNSCDYHDGGSEIRMGKALKDGYRKRVFLMTKYNGRTRDMAAKQIDESLRRLQGDDRPDSVPREHPNGRSGSLLRSGRRAGGGDGREKGRQGAIHRIHRA